MPVEPGEQGSRRRQVADRRLAPASRPRLSDSGRDATRVGTDLQSIALGRAPVEPLFTSDPTRRRPPRGPRSRPSRRLSALPEKKDEDRHPALAIRPGPASAPGGCHYRPVGIRALDPIDRSAPLARGWPEGVIQRVFIGSSSRAGLSPRRSTGCDPPRMAHGCRDSAGGPSARPPPRSDRTFGRMSTADACAIPKTPRNHVCQSRRNPCPKTDD
jgi:hypothetical protein